MWNLGAFPSEHRTQASHLTPQTQLLDTQSRRERGRSTRSSDLWTLCPSPFKESLLRVQKPEKASPLLRETRKRRTSFTFSSKSGFLQPPLLCSALCTRPYTHEGGKEEMT